MKENAETFNKEDMLRNLSIEIQEENIRLKEVIENQENMIRILSDRVSMYEKSIRDDVVVLDVLEKEYRKKNEELNQIIGKYKKIVTDMEIQKKRFDKVSNKSMGLLQRLLKGKEV